MTRTLLINQTAGYYKGIEVNKKLIGIVLAVMLGIILIESYFLLVQPNQTASDVENPKDTTSQTPGSSSPGETSDSPSATDNSTLPDETSTESSNGTNNVVLNSFVPAVPEFTVKLIDTSYDVPTTYSTDPYTGKTITQEGYHVERRTIEIRIKNQPFATNPLSPREVMYNIRVKGYFGQEWRELYHPSDGYPTPSDSEYTVLNFSSSGGSDFYGFRNALIVAPSRGQVDFQVEAMYGGIGKDLEEGPLGPLYFVGETSGWSKTQTITVP